MNPKRIQNSTFEAPPDLSATYPPIITPIIGAVTQTNPIDTIARFLSNLRTISKKLVPQNKNTETVKNYITKAKQL